MGWGSGSRLFSEIIKSLNDAEVSKEQRLIIYPKLIAAFEDADCDNLHECEDEDLMFNKCLRAAHPSWYE